MIKLKQILIVLALISASLTTFAHAELVVVVNNASGAALTKNDVSRIFLGKKKGFTPVNIKSGNPLREEFNKSALNKSSSQIKAYWSKLVFSGKGTPPKELGSDAEIKAFVAGNPNAIGYINSKSLDSSVKAALTL